MQITIFALRYNEFLYRIYNKDHYFHEDDILYNSRQEAKETAIYKAFEIL